jgi:hypothetical protein
VARRSDALEAALRRTLVRRSTDETTLEPADLPLANLAEVLDLGLRSIQRAPVTQLLAALRPRRAGLR